MLRILPFYFRGLGSIPSWGTKVPQVVCSTPRPTPTKEQMVVRRKEEGQDYLALLFSSVGVRLPVS